MTFASISYSLLSQFIVFFVVLKALTLYIKLIMLEAATLSISLFAECFTYYCKMWWLLRQCLQKHQKTKKRYLLPTLSIWCICFMHYALCTMFCLPLRAKILGITPYSTLTLYIYPTSVYFLLHNSLELCQKANLTDILVIRRNTSLSPTEQI